MAAKGVAPVAEPEEPKEETCIIDNLLKEIREGTTLRRTGQTSVHRRRRGSQLNKEDLEKLNQIVEKAATTPRKLLSPPTGKDPQFTFSVLPEENENEVNRREAVHGSSKPLENGEVVVIGNAVKVEDSNGVESNSSAQSPAVDELNHEPSTNGESSAYLNGDAIQVEGSTGSKTSNSQSHTVDEENCKPIANGETNTSLNGGIIQVEGSTGSKTSSGRSHTIESDAHLNGDIVRVEDSTGSRSSSGATIGGGGHAPTASGVSNADLNGDIVRGTSDTGLGEQTSSGQHQDAISEGRHISTATRVTNTDLKVGSKPTVADRQSSVGTGTTQPEHLISPLIGNTATASSTLPTSPANDRSVHEGIHQTVTTTDKDLREGGSLERDKEEVLDSGEGSESSLRLKVSCYV